MDAIVIVWSIVSFLLFAIIGLLIWALKNFITKIQNDTMLSNKADLELKGENTEIRNDLKLAIVNLTNELKTQSMSCDIKMSPIISSVKEHNEIIRKHTDLISRNVTRIDSHEDILKRQEAKLKEYEKNRIS